MEIIQTVEIISVFAIASANAALAPECHAKDHFA
jgi:hypothetical protein